MEREEENETRPPSVPSALQTGTLRAEPWAGKSVELR